jgi:hypothetical protein
MYLRFILESYELIANAITRDKENGIIELVISPFFVDDMDRLIDVLRIEFPIRILAPNYAESSLR